MKNDINHTAPNLVVMLTCNDYTVNDAEQVFDSCAGSKALYWGMKESPLPLHDMKRIFAKMKKAGKITALEVVGYTPEEGLRGAEVAADCGCDILMGTVYNPAIARLCNARNIKYMPFVGKISGRPSVLSGGIDDITAEAERIVADGVFGIDILAYRHKDNPVGLVRELVAKSGGNICVAGSIDSFERLDEIKRLAPWGFTIGSAFFNNRFGDSFAGQIDTVIDYMG